MKNTFLFFFVFVFAVLFLFNCRKYDVDEGNRILRVTFETNGGTGYISDQLVPYRERIKKMPVTPKKPGFIFDGWYYRDSNFFDSTQPIIQQAALYAKWVIAPNVYLYADSRGGTPKPKQKLIKNYELSLPFKIYPEPIKRSYKFRGWFYDTLGRDTFNFSAPLSADDTMFAYWDRASYHTLTFINYSSSLHRIDIDTVYENEVTKAFVSPTHPHEDTFFSAWVQQLNNPSVRPFKFGDSLKKNDTVYAMFFTPRRYTLSFNSNGGSILPSRDVKEGVTVRNTPVPEYGNRHFLGWFYDRRCTENVYFDLGFYGNTTVYAKWDPPGSVVAPHTFSYSPAQQTILFGESGSSVIPTINDGGAIASFVLQTPVSGIAIDATTGQISWDPSLVAGTYILNIIPSNSAGVGVPLSYTLTVKETYTVTFDGGRPVPVRRIVQLTQAQAPDLPTKTDSTFVAWFMDAERTAQVAFPLTLTTNITLYPKFTPILYTVSFDNNGASPAIDNQTVAHNDPAITPDPPTKLDSTFDGWFTTVSRTTSFTFTTPIRATTTLYAKFIPITYTVSFDNNGASPAIDNQTVAHNDPAITPDPPTKLDSAFDGWFTTASRTTPFVFTTPIRASITLYAKFSPIVYTVSFDNNGASPSTATQSLTSGTTATVPTAPTKTDSTFDGWFTDVSRTTSFTFTTPIRATTTLYAKFSPITYTVSFDNNGASPSTATQSLTIGTLATRPTAPTKLDSTFDGWFTTVSRTTTFDFSTPIRATTTLYAKFSPIVYTVNFVHTGTSAAITPQQVTRGTLATVPAAPTKTNNTFAGWFTDVSRTTGFLFTTVITANTTLYAKFSPIVYTVSFDNNGASPAIDNQTVAHNDPAITPDPPTKLDSAFDGWFTTVSRTTVFDFTTPIRASTTVHAKYTPIVYTVSFDNNGATPSIATQSLTSGTTATAPTAPTKTDSTFGGWFTDASRTTSFVFTTPIRATTTLYAKFSPILYTVNFVHTGTSATITPLQVTSGTVATAPTDPTKTDSSFDGWYTDMSRTTPFNFDTVIRADKTLYSRFVPLGCVAANNKTYINTTCYRTVNIEGRTWLAENLNDSIHTVGASSCYDDNASNCSTFGRLYNWEAAMDTDEKIPGWHLPSKTEWNAFAASLGGPNPSVVGEKMITGGSSGFNALLSGYKNLSGLYSEMDLSTGFWSSTPNSNGVHASYSYLSSSSAIPPVFSSVVRDDFRTARYPIRLLKD